MYLIVFIVGFLFVVVGVMIVIVFYIGVVEWIREIGVFWVIGYCKCYICGFFMMEVSYIIILVNVLLSFVVVIIVKIVSFILEMKIGFEDMIYILFWNFFVIFVIIIIIGFIFLIYLSNKVVKLDVVEVLRLEWFN